jgi:pimeloyl-ACP methyl ester carboxylesterase
LLNYLRKGAGEPVVLLHGLFGSAKYWDSLIDHLSPSFDLIAIDLPGFGGSGKISVPNDVSGYGATVMALLQSLNVSSFNILGHSLGGAIAQQMSLDYPESVIRLVAYATKPAVLDEDRFETFEKTMERVLNTDITDVVKSQAANWFDAGTDSLNYDLCIKTSLGVSSESAGACLQAIRGWDVWELLDKLNLPVLVISGDRDQSVSLETLIRQKQAFPNAQLAILPGCAHIAHLENSELFNHVVGDFLFDKRSLD